LTVLLLFWLAHSSKQAPEQKIVIREVALVAPPPPPPPPTIQQAVVETPITVQVQGAGPSIQMVTVDPTITMRKPDIPPIAPTESKWQTLTVEWDSFELDQLDGLPVLLTPLRIKFPKSLRRQGIKSALIKLEVVIDENGHLTLIEIIENPHHQLLNEIQRLIRTSRFSAPTKDNTPVRARFIWPLAIKST